MVPWGSDIRGSTICNDTEVCVWLVWLSTRLHHTYIVRRDTYHQMTSVHLADGAPGHCGGREIRVRQALDRYKLSRRGKYGSYSHTTLAFSLRICNESNIQFIFTLWNPIAFFVSSPKDLIVAELNTCTSLSFALFLQANINMCKEWERVSNGVTGRGHI